MTANQSPPARPDGDALSADSHFENSVLVAMHATLSSGAIKALTVTTPDDGIAGVSIERATLPTILFAKEILALCTSPARNAAEGGGLENLARTIAQADFIWELGESGVMACSPELAGKQFDQAYDTDKKQKYLHIAQVISAKSAPPKPAPDAVRAEAKRLIERARLYSNPPKVLDDCVAFLMRLSAPVPPADGAGDPPHWREVEMMRLIDLLRSEEGDSVEIFCDNPDFGLGANNTVSCNGWWTGHRDRHFEGVSLLDALSATMIEYKRPKSSDGGVESQTRGEVSADERSPIADGNVDSLGVAPGPSETLPPSATGAAEPDALADLVSRFSTALLAKLHHARDIKGRSGWDEANWMRDCQRALLAHVPKGDALDVAAYTAFCWHHGWSTALEDKCPLCGGEGVLPPDGGGCEKCNGSGRLATR